MCARSDFPPYNDPPPNAPVRIASARTWIQECADAHVDTNFRAQLWRLFAKADLVNRAKLTAAYPAEALIWTAWYEQWPPERLARELTPALEATL